MVQLIADKEVCGEFLSAMQTLLNIFCKVENERDVLLGRIKMLELERQENIKIKCNQSPSDDLIPTQIDESQRKRIKTEPFKKPDFTKSFHDVSNDDLNAAFHEDDVIAPTQPPPPQHHLSLHKAKKIATPQRDKKESKEQNKENKDGIRHQNRPSPRHIERSPTVLSKHSVRTETKVSSNLNESTWISKTSVKNTTPRRLFDNWTTTKNPTPSQLPKPTSNTRKKLSLSLSSNPARLKQSTITFAKRCDEEETFCEGVSVGPDEMQLDTSANVSAMEDLGAAGPSTQRQCSPTSGDSVIIQANQSNEVIMIDESQSTEELYNYVADIKLELQSEEARANVDNSPLVVPKTPPKPESNYELNKFGIDCEDCKQYHRMVGRDVEKNPPRKYGVCAKHRRNVISADTPPGFWNPKISDSESDHEETPYDPRYAKKNLH